jgi:hypothetical protein
MTVGRHRRPFRFGRTAFVRLSELECETLFEIREAFFNFDGIITRIERRRDRCAIALSPPSRADVRAACRRLRALGLAEYQRGLFTEDGEAYGAGYRATLEGRHASRAFAAAIEAAERAAEAA